MSVATAVLSVVLIGAATVIGAPVTGQAQRSVTRHEQAVTASATIEKIDKTDRLITFKKDDGTEETAVAGPEFKRFDELKAGDKVNVTYYESLVYQLRPAGSGEPPASGAVAGTTGSTLPGGGMATQTVRTVTVKAVDADTGSLTVVTQDGRTITRQVEDKSELQGVKPGDHIDIVLTRAVLAAVERK